MNRKNISIIILIVSILSSLSAVAKEENQQLTLSEVHAIALQNYPQIVAAESAVKAAEQSVEISRSYYLPQITGNAVRAFAGESTRLSATGGLNNPGVIDRGSIGVSVSQLITDFGHTSNLIEFSKFELQAQRARNQLTRETVLLDATLAYYNLLCSQSLLKVAQTTLKVRKTFLEQISSLHNSKLKSTIDLGIANQMVSSAELLLLKAKNGVEDAQATLSEALGYGEPRTFILADHTKATPPPEDIDMLMENAINQNPKLAAIKAQHDAAKKRAEAGASAQYPVVSALGYAGKTPIRKADQPIKSNSLTVGINVSIPFYTGGRLTAQEHEASYKADIEEQNFITLKNQLLRDIRITFGKVKTSYQNLRVTGLLESNANEVLDLTRERYNIGSSSIEDLGQAYLAQTQAQIECANSVYEYMINRAILDYKIGNKICTSQSEEEMFE